MSRGCSSSVRLRASLASTALVILGGCTTLGGNVKGSFSCVAPDGICAPSSSIDDRALAMIAGESGAGDVVPAGPVIDTRPKTRPSRTASAVARSPIERGDPQRTRERVLRIVFQPYVDTLGRLHEASAVHAVVETGAWQQQVIASSTAIADPNARAGVAMGSLAEAIDRADLIGPELTALDPDLPDPAVVAAARARAPAPDPLSAIRNDVAARLAPKAGRTPRAVTRSTARPLEKKASAEGATTQMVAKGTAAGSKKAPSIVPDPAGLAPGMTTRSADEAVTGVKVGAPSTGIVTNAGNLAPLRARARPVPATTPTSKAPVQAAGFPGSVPEDN